MIIKQLAILLLSFVLFVSGSEIFLQEQSEASDLILLTAQITENQEIKAFSMLLNFVDIICQESLKQTNPADMEAFAINWLEGLFEVVQETFKKNSYQEVQFEEHEVDFSVDGNFLNQQDFDVVTLRQQPAFDIKNFMATGQILFSDDSSSEFSSSDEDEDEFRPESKHNSVLYSLLKSKMMTGDYDEETAEVGGDGKEDYTGDFVPASEENSFGVSFPLVQKEITYEEEKKSDIDSSSGSDRENHQCHLQLKKRRGGGRGRLDGIEAGMLNMVVDAATSEAGIGQLTNLAGAAIAPNSGPQSDFDQTEMMEQLKQQVMSHVMEQLVQQNPQFAQFSSLLQDERGKLTAALGTNADGLPQLSREGVIDFLRTSALPKLLNSAIKGKTGVDVLKSLSMILRVVNEGLGILEVILKVLLRTTRAVRYYSLCASSVVADMAREDNMTPIVDLSVSVDILPDVVAKKSITGRMNKMFRKALRKSSDNGDDDSSSSSPFTLGLQAALSKARDYTTQFQQIPPKLLLTVIHTIFTELEKRDGIVRAALAKKQHKTLISLQDSVNKAVETIYRAIIKEIPEAADHLHLVPARIFTDIILSLISPVNMESAKMNEHLSKVTKWIKPLMSILDQDSQLSILNFLLTDPEAENVFTKSNGKASSARAPVKTFHWSFHGKRNCEK